MKKRFVRYLFNGIISLTTCVTAAAQKTFPATSPREHISLDADWRFHLGHAADPTQDFNYGLTAIFSKTGKADGTAIASDFSDSTWRRLDIPHDWAVELPFGNSPSFDVMAHGYKPVGRAYPATSIGWYRKHIFIPRTDSGRRLRIAFDGIFRDSRIWINGFYLGNNPSGYSDCSFDITDYIRYDRDNLIAIRVDATQYEGWFYEGAGIYRHVWLDKYDQLHIPENGLYVHSTVGKEQTTVHIESTILNEGDATTATVTSFLIDKEGRALGQTAATPIRLQTGASQTLKQQITVTHPHLWSPDAPYLYRIRTVVMKGSRSIDEMSLRIGIRTFRIDASGLYVNGIYTKVKGINAHQDHAGVGSAMPDYLHYYRVGLLKQMGANAYRTSHNPPARELLDACDSLGMLVLDENRLLNGSPEYMTQWERLLLRDRSRASVFLWSIGNEEGYVQTNDIGKAIAKTLLRRQQTLDPERLSTYAADLANTFQGINEVIPVRGFNYRVPGVDPYHKDHPGQPIIGTEMGSTVTTRGIYTKDSVACYLPDEDITAPWWANKAEEWWPLAATRPWWMGGFIWTGFDYRGEPTPFQWPNISSHFGVMDICGFPKNLFYYYQSCWSSNDILHISPHWNWKGREGETIPVWIYTNADSVELSLNGKSLGRKIMQPAMHLEWNVAYAAGRLSAIGWRNGRKIEDLVETTDIPYEVIVTPYKTTMMADAKDATVVNITVTDKRGREVPDASNLIHFTAGKGLRILGVGNGDPSSHEPDICPDGVWQRHLFNGKAQVIVRSEHSSGLIRFEASADGLQTGSTDIYTIAAAPPMPPACDLGRQKQWAPARPVRKMLGADISFLPELEAKGIHFSDKGIQKDAIAILKAHGFNYIRLRIFNDPANDSGYSPGKGFCDLAHTLAMARRIKAAGMHLLLDFHYSDYWADPGKQFKPAAWKNTPLAQLTDSIFLFTGIVLQALKDQNTPPDMVQIGNEINHGILWPEGSIANPDNLASFLYAGARAVRTVAPGTPIMLHIALGGQNAESHFFLDNMISRNVPFDVIGLSYYPKWHGTLADLKYNVDNLAASYKKDIIVVEYTQLKKEVNRIAFSIPGNRGKGTCIWEPLNTWEQIFDKQGNSNELLPVYDELGREYIKQ